MSNKISGDDEAVRFHAIDLQDFGLEQIYAPDAEPTVKAPSGHSC